MRIKLGKKLSLLVIALGFSCVAMAQQEPQFSQYMFNRMSYNPGYAGSSGSISATAMYRNQWMGFKLDNPTEGNDAGSTPSDILFALDFPVRFLHGGLGLSFVKDAIGYHDNIDLALDYAFRMFWGEGNLSAGVEFGMNQMSMDLSQLHGHDAGDPLIHGQKESDMLFDASVGLYYQVPGKYYWGVSVKNLLGAHSDKLEYTHARTVYAMGGYDITPASAPSVRIKPSFLVKTANFSYFQADLSCLFDYQNAFWAGAGYRVQDALYLTAGVHMKQFRIGASYDFITSAIGGPFKGGRSFGSLELYLRFTFKPVVPKKPDTRYQNTIFLD